MKFALFWSMHTFPTVSYLACGARVCQIRDCCVRTAVTVVYVQRVRVSTREEVSDSVEDRCRWFVSMRLGRRNVSVLLNSQTLSVLNICCRFF